MRAAIAQGLSKSYSSSQKALDRVSFTLEEGEVFGFLGPNGAGKTTTVKLLCGMLAPTEGSCRVFDVNPATHPNEAHRHCGVVTEHALMYDSLSGMENLLFYGKMFGLPSPECAARAEKMLKQLELFDARDKKLGAYSSGMRQRLSLARAMIHNPRMLFLDEPTSGLDPESVQSVNALIRALAREEGTTIFLCTHQLRYAQEICTTYGLIDRGKLLAVGDIDSLRADALPGIKLKIRADAFPEDLERIIDSDGFHEIAIQSEEEIPAIIRRIVHGGGSVYHVSAQHASLEDIYFALIERAKKEAGA